MEARTVVVLLAASILVSGCTNIPGVDSSPFSDKDQNSENLKSNPVAGKGLEIKSMEVVDPTLRPGQSTILKVTFENYHVSETIFDDIQVYNTGSVKVDDRIGPNCSPESIGVSRRGLNPEMVCEFDLDVPEDFDMGGFNSKKINMGLQATYLTSITNTGKQYEADFRPASEIEKAGEKTAQYSNGEVKVSLSSDQPFPSEDGGTIRFDIKPTSRGTILETDSGHVYKVSIDSASSIFEGGNCGDEFKVGDDQNFKPLVGNEARFSCEVATDSDSALTQPVVFSIAYKYRISTSFDIEVISNAT